MILAGVQWQATLTMQAGITAGLLAQRMPCRASLEGMQEGNTRSLASSSYLDGRSVQGMPGPDQVSFERTPINVGLPAASVDAAYLWGLM